MTRPIKFRAWDKKNKCWEYIILLPGGKIDFKGRKLDSFEAIEAETDLSDWQQLTGLLDKNGKEIYEGDVLSSGPIKYTVRFGEYPGYNKEPNQGFYVLYEDEGKDLTRSAFALPPGDEFEIIGNIYENPNLIK